MFIIVKNIDIYIIYTCTILLFEPINLLEMKGSHDV